MHRGFAPRSLAHFENQLFCLTLIVNERSTGDKLEFIAQHKINSVLEYLNNADEDFRQPSLPHISRGEQSVVLPVGCKNALVST